jgi:YihY family inner membrane protein
MSTANVVPETWELTGDDARETLRRTGRLRLFRDAMKRLRAADGFSHARALAFATALVLVQAIIAMVGLATALGRGAASDLIVGTLRSAAPGPAGVVLTQAVDQANRAGASHRYLALLIGLIGAIVSSCTFMGQLERGLNRLYGLEQDRPALRKYGLALLLTISAGALATVAFAAVALGDSIGSSLGNVAASLWSWIRWPLGLLLMTAAVAMLFRLSPRRRQPAWSWLAFGAMVSIGLWSIATFMLSLFFHISPSFGQTYGPLAGIVALLLWSLLSSIALLLGAAVGAQLEAVRAGAPAPKNAGKVAGSVPRGHDLTGFHPPENGQVSITESEPFGRR